MINWPRDLLAKFVIKTVIRQFVWRYVVGRSNGHPIVHGGASKLVYIGSWVEEEKDMWVWGIHYSACRRKFSEDRIISFYSEVACPTSEEVKSGQWKGLSKGINKSKELLWLIIITDGFVNSYLILLLLLIEKTISQFTSLQLQRPILFPGK